MRDNLGLNGSQKDKDRDVDGSNEGHDDDDCMFVWGDEEDSGDEDDTIFIDGKDVMPCNEDLFIVLNRDWLTWLNLSAILTENWSLNQIKLWSVSFFKAFENKLLPLITANFELTSP